MSRVLESSGAQVLPDIGDVRVTTTGWMVHLACDADLRARYPLWREFAGRLVVTA